MMFYLFNVIAGLIVYITYFTQCFQINLVKYQKQEIKINQRELPGVLLVIQEKLKLFLPTPYGKRKIKHSS